MKNKASETGSSGSDCGGDIGASGHCYCHQPLTSNKQLFIAYSATAVELLIHQSET